MQKQKDYLLRFRYYKEKTNDSKTTYLRYSKLLKKYIAIAQKYTNNKYLERSQNICRSSWKLIKEETEEAIPVNDISEIKYQNKVIRNGKEISELFNDFYIKLTGDLYNYDSDRKQQILSNIEPVLNSIFLEPVTLVETVNIIQSLKNSSSCGYDEISTKALKFCKNELTKILTFLINLSFETGHFPDALKYSIVKPLYKKKRQIRDW